MAEQKVDQNLGLVYTLGVAAGIKRDGTSFESREFTDGVWTRFQRKVPRKMGGYRQMFRDPNGIARGIISNAYNGVNYVFTGTSNTLDVFTSSTNLGTGSGPFSAVFTGALVNTNTFLVEGSGYTNGTYTNVVLTGLSFA